MGQNPISDEYFNRSEKVVRGTPEYDQIVRYGVFARQEGILCGMEEAIPFIDEHCQGPLTIRALSDGECFRANETVMILEGRFGELVSLETTYLGMLSLSGAATNMRRLVEVAAPCSVVDMSARHYPPELIGPIAYAAAVGGAQGTSTQAGQTYVTERLGTGQGDQIQLSDREPEEFKVYGSIPHALNAVFSGSSMESAKAYYAKLPGTPLTVLIDFEGRELDICRQAAQEFGKDLFAVRIDTHSGRIHQGGHAEPVSELVEKILSQANDGGAARVAIEKYGFGLGVTIESVYNVRAALDEAGAKHTQIIVSSGFTVDKVKAFCAAWAPMDAIGTGSWVDFMMFTSDITHVQRNERWQPCCKAGRANEFIQIIPDIRVQK